jgi:ribosomal protein S18 acetylase RimI-like enzyme
MSTSRVNSAPAAIEPIRIDPNSFDDWQALLDLILDAFAYMNGVVDPPSSAIRLTVQSLREKAASEIGFIVREHGQLLGCIFLRPEPPDFLYIGKLAVLPQAQGKGIGSMLLEKATEVARSCNLPKLRLETRIELTGNHERFAKWGFVKTAENSHKGFDRTTSIEMQRPA